ncbi:MAG: 2-C-methyl-D-erythritol 2,4-cyclodiphosphate synthase [Parachlamydiaceae bacterium]|nr:2-C-methyl-D-erythritol 2,4-cyclodiphosphate synthase [Parachlamydiaceae bacterium]
MQRLFKIGYGYDSHRFLNQEEKSHLEHNPVLDLETEYHTHDKKLIIGGVILEEKFQKKFGPFKARSDGDVLYHAVINALLSALSQKESRDIGTLFPNTDQINSNRDSADFLKKAAELVQESDYELLDLKIMVKSVPRVNWNLVEKNLTSFFNFQNISPDIHIQGTSGEEMDGAGNGLGVEVFVVCLLQNKKLQI